MNGLCEQGRGGVDVLGARVDLTRFDARRYGSVKALTSGPAVEKCVKETMYSLPPIE